MKKLLLAAALLAATALGAATRSPKAAISRNLDIFASVFKALQTSYVDTIDADKSVQTAIDAMLDEIDPYTEYFPEKESDELLSISTGEYGGIGSFIQQRPDGRVMVSGPRDGSPARLSGLRNGDVFVAINDSSVVGKPSSEISKLLRGQAGTTVKVKVKRPHVSGADSLQTFDITREKIEIKGVPYYGMVRPGVGYIQIATFSEKTYDEVREALDSLRKEPEMKSLILDLRDNGGGLLESAVKIVGLFVPKGTEVLRTRGRGLLGEKIYKTTTKPVDTKIPMAVLINGGSASSAEIVSGALQDLDRAVLVGDRSFGKGLVQSTHSIPYNGVLKVTTAKYYIPSGRLIQAIDYSRRNPDGSVARIPDSLTTVWHTRAGRPVRDGGGITPDIKVESPELNRLVYNAVRDNWIFDFATLVAATDSMEGVGPETFEITDSLYGRFKAFIDPGKFKYDKACSMVLDDLQKAAKLEGYLDTAVQAQIDSLRASLRHDLPHDLEYNRPVLTTFMAPEIANRYWGERGATIVGLRSDYAVDSATTVLRAPERYKSLLSGPK